MICQKIKTFLYRCIARILRPTSFDTLYLRSLYRYIMGCHIDLKNPITFTEKIQWLKLYNRNPLYHTLVDKYAVKKYVTNIIGSRYIIPSLGIWDSPEEIDWDKLPSQFVLKTTHYGGGEGIIICRDKGILDKEKTKQILRKTLTKSLYPYHREWPYKGLKPRVLAEKYMVDHNLATNKDLIDYKFYCFNGEPIYCQVISGRGNHKVIDFFDMDWNLMPFTGLSVNAIHSNMTLPRPENLSDMKEIARKLSQNIPFIRIDLYLINGDIYFGEMTFFPNSGFGTFVPSEWNYRMGRLIKLPTDKNVGYVD